MLYNCLFCIPGCTVADVLADILHYVGGCAVNILCHTLPPSTMHSFMRLLNTNDPLTCECCSKRLKTAQGLLAHLSSAKRCQQYKKGKLRELTLAGTLEEMADELETTEPEVPDIPFLPSQIHHSRSQNDIPPAHLASEVEDRYFELLPLQPDYAMGSNPSSSSRHSPGRETESYDERIEEDPFPDAGKVLRTDDTRHEKWRRLFGEKDLEGDTLMDDRDSSSLKFAPFASELDWRVARWAIQDGIGHKSFDRLLSIPGVSEQSSIYAIL